MKTHGFLVFDKPGGLTSRDVVNRVQRLFPKRTKLGHAGTLDPLATGVLVLAVGQATRFIEYVQALGKVYETRIVLGARSTTDDADGEVTPTPMATPVAEEAMRAALPLFLGTIEQTPPAFSAAHVDGQRAYHLARRGAEVRLAPRPVTIEQIVVQHYTWPVLDLEIACGKGTYIRSIARDLGERLGVGGYVQTLRRTAIGSFTTATALTLAATRDEVHAQLLPITGALPHLPRLSFDAVQIAQVRFGQTVPVQHDDGLAFVVDGNEELIALGTITNGLFQPDKVLPVDAD